LHLFHISASIISQFGRGLNCGGEALQVSGDLRLACFVKRADDLLDISPNLPEIDESRAACGAYRDRANRCLMEVQSDLPFQDLDFSSRESLKVLNPLPIARLEGLADRTAECVANAHCLVEVGKGAIDQTMNVIQEIVQRCPRS